MFTILSSMQAGREQGQADGGAESVKHNKLTVQQWIFLKTYWLPALRDSCKICASKYTKKKKSFFAKWWYELKTSSVSKALLILVVALVVLIQDRLGDFIKG